MVIDEQTLQVTITRPIQYFLQKLTYPTSYIVHQQAVEAVLEDWTEAPNGSGPFKLKQWDKDEIMILARHDVYNMGAPKLKHIVYLMFAGQPMTMYENSEIDIAGVGSSNIERATDPTNVLNADLRVEDNYCTTYLWFNPESDEFGDFNVRKAFAMVIDIDKVIEVGRKGNVTRATTLLPPGIRVTEIGSQQLASIPRRRAGFLLIRAYVNF